MNNQIENSYHKFRLLRNKVDKTCNKLHLLHHDFTSCKKGCDECCMNFSLLPVEFHSILKSIKGQEITIQLSGDNDSCPFLLDHSCQIYEFRPIICRSHGLPILTMDEEGENWELSFCPLNFKENDDDYFTPKSCYQQDVFNSKLYLLNQEFINCFEEEKFNDTDMLDLRMLAERL
jgi:uncharacterized protein